MHVCQDWAAWNAVIAVISLGSCSRKSLIRMYICTFVDVDHDFHQIIRTWNALSWSCSRKPLIKTHIWRNYVIKGVGELFKGVVAKNIYHYRRCWFLTYLNLNWWPWLSSGDDEWPTAMGHSWELYIQNTHSERSSSCFNEVTFYGRKRFLDKCNCNPEHTLLLRPKGGFCVLLHFFCLWLLLSVLPSSRVRST